MSIARRTSQVLSYLLMFASIAACMLFSFDRRYIYKSSVYTVHEYTGFYKEEFCALSPKYLRIGCNGYGEDKAVWFINGHKAFALRRGEMIIIKDSIVIKVMTKDEVEKSMLSVGSVYWKFIGIGN